MRQNHCFHWACQFQYRNWQHVLFSDESRFQLFRADGRTWLYQRAGERTALCCVQETVPFGAGSLMVWGGICSQQRTDLIIIMDIHVIETCSLWSNLFTFVMSGPM